MKARISAQWAHDDAAYRFPRTSGLSAYHFAPDRRPQRILAFLVRNLDWIATAGALLLLAVMERITR